MVCFLVQNCTTVSMKLYTYSFYLRAEAKD